MKPFWLYASSILSVAIALLDSPIRAEEPFPVLRASQDITFELNSLSSLELSSAPSAENLTLANFDELAFEELHHAPTEGLFASSEELVYSAQPLKADHRSSEPSAGSVEPSEASESVEPIEPSFPPYPIEGDFQLSEPATDQQPLSSDLIAQDESTPQPAEPSSDPALSERWQFSLEPYFFIPLNVQADVTVNGRRTSIDLGLDDILNLDRAFDAGLRLEARHNRWGFILDGFYLFAGNSGSLGRTFSAGSLLQFVQQADPGRVEQFIQQFDPEQIQQVAQQLGERQIGLNTPVRVTADGSISIRQITVDAAVSYRVVDTSLNNSSEEAFYPRLMVAPIVGLRTNFLRQTIEVDDVRIDNIPIADERLPTIDRDFRFSRTLVEPLIGAQFGLDLSERWALGLRGDVSGFNIGADRNLTWNLLVGAQYRLSRLTSLQLAYRFNSFDFEDGEGLRRTKLNLDQNGLWLSAVFQF